ncbi:MAG: shikimate kinase [Candidatus Gracilibacteria bacterium]|jgi:shikimate kinase
MIIALTGLRGSGKTKLGLLLAKKLNVKFYDLDKEIEKTSKTNIKDLVEKKGWETFRESENKILKKIIEKINKKKKLTILSLGGGAIIQKENTKLIRKNCLIVYLRDTPENCAKKISDSNKKHAIDNRPALTSQKTLLSEMKELYETRHEIYKKNSDIILKRSDDEEKDAEKIIKKILNLHP